MRRTIQVKIADAAGGFYRNSILDAAPPGTKASSRQHSSGLPTHHPASLPRLEPFFAGTPCRT